MSRHAGVPVVLSMTHQPRHSVCPTPVLTPPPLPLCTEERTSRATAAHAASPHGLKPRVQPPRRPVLTSTKKALQHSVSAVSAALGLPVEGGAAGGAAAGMGAGPGAGVPNGSSRGFRGSSSRAGGGGAWTARNAATRRDALRMLGKSRTVGDLLPQQKTALQCVWCCCSTPFRLLFSLSLEVAVPCVHQARTSIHHQQLGKAWCLDHQPCCVCQVVDERTFQNTRNSYNCVSLGQVNASHRVVDGSKQAHLQHGARRVGRKLQLHRTRPRSTTNNNKCHTNNSVSYDDADDDDAVK